MPRIPRSRRDAQKNQHPKNTIKLSGNRNSDETGGEEHEYCTESKGNPEVLPGKCPWETGPEICRRRRPRMRADDAGSQAPAENPGTQRPGDPRLGPV